MLQGLGSLAGEDVCLDDEDDGVYSGPVLIGPVLIGKFCWDFLKILARSGTSFYAVVEQMMLSL